MTLRPVEVIWAYWCEVLAVEEDAERYEPIYWEAA